MSTGTRKAVGLRRSVLDSKSRRKSGKGGWRGTWKDRLDIPKAEETDILLTRGEYVNPEDVDKESGELGLAHFHTCKVHGLKLKTSGPGSYLTARCNIDAGQEDCLCCMKKEQGDRRVTMKDNFSFNCLHLALHEKVDLVRDGKVVKYEDGENRGKAIQTWEEVDKPRRKKELLEDIDNLVEKGEAALFRKKYIEVGAGFRDELSQIDEMASHFCKCGGELTPILFTCEECKELLADVEKDDMSKKEVAAFASSREKCPNKDCGHVGLPVPEMVCGDCKDPAPLSAFDVVATIKKEGEGAQSHIVIKKITPLDRYQLPNGASLIKWFKNKKGDFEPEFENDDFVFTEDFDVKKTVDSQWDFEKVHEPREHGFIAKQLGCENPFKSTGAGKYKDYDGGGSGGGSRTRVDDGDDRRGRGRGRDGDDRDKEDEDDRNEDRGRGRGREDDDDRRGGGRRRVGSR